MASVIYSDFCLMVDKNWNDIENLASKHHYWVNRNDDNTGKRRSSMASLFCEDEKDLRKIQNAKNWLSIKQRIEALFNILGQNGCFILKKGTIENYYKSDSPSEDKVSLAVDESDRIELLDNAQISLDYADIEQALIFASQLQKIDEASALRDLLLASTTPILSRLSEIKLVSEIESLVYQILGERSSMFKFDIIDIKGQNKKLVVDCKSSILDISGFPLEIDMYENPINKIKEKIINKN